MSNIPDRKHGFVRILFFEVASGTAWIYDIPLHDFHPLEKFMIENYHLIPNDIMPKNITSLYVVSTFLNISYRGYQTWINFIDDADLDEIPCDYQLSNEIIGFTLEEVYNLNTEDIARIVVMIHIAARLTEKDNISSRDLVKVLENVWHIYIPERLINRFKPGGDMYSVTYEVGVCLFQVLG